MKILFLTDNFPPEVNAPATRTYEHCKEWVKLGAEVTVITCFPNFPKGKVYDGYKNKLYQKEEIDGIKVIRVWTYITANKGFGKRIIDYISFGIMAVIFGLFIKTDIIVGTSPQFFTAVGARVLAFLRRKPWIMEVRDIWPESIKTVGAATEDSKAIKLLEKIEVHLYKSATRLIVVTDTFKKTIIGKGINGDKIEVVKNGANLELFQPKEKNYEIVNQLNLQDKFVIGYIGTHGMAHSLDFIVNAISKVTDTELHFLFVGDGAVKNEIVKQAKSLKLTNITFIDSVSKDKVGDYISVLDAMLVPLKKTDNFKTVIPSKIFETSAMQIPILLGVDGESRGIIEKYNAGLYFEPENEEELLSQIKKLKSDPILYNNIKKGEKKLAIDFDRKKLAKTMLYYINSTVKSKKRILALNPTEL